jgi:hypothetical protein
MPYVERDEPSLANDLTLKALPPKNLSNEEKVEPPLTLAKTERVEPNLTKALMLIELPCVIVSKIVKHDPNFVKP